MYPDVIASTLKHRKSLNTNSHIQVSDLFKYFFTKWNVKITVKIYYLKMEEKNKNHCLKYIKNNASILQHR